MGIERVKIRAKVTVGTTSIETPYILSFNVRRSRNQVSTFDVRLKVDSSTGNGLTGGPIQIYAGENDAGTRIFTGIVRKVTMTPCFDDPSYTILNLSGVDVLGYLQGKKFTRRCAATKTSWVTINGVSRAGLKSGKFKYKREPVLLVTDSELGESVSATETVNTTAKSPYDGGILAPKKSAGSVKLEATPMMSGETV